jgi:ribosomal protein S18 acetylase RimI-like enzyme
MDRIRSDGGDEIEIGPAEPGELGVVLDILVEAAHWQTARGLTQWFPELFTIVLRAEIERQIGAGEVYLARIDGEAVGTLTLQWADEPVWGPQPDDAGYVHRLAVRRGQAGRGIGRALLDWAGARCAAEGRAYLRLDTMSSNADLRAHYERLGFEFRGVNPGPVWKPARYERPAAAGDGAPAAPPASPKASAISS